MSLENTQGPQNTPQQVAPAVNPTVNRDEAKALQAILDAKSCISSIEGMYDSYKSQIFAKLEIAEDLIHAHIGYRAVKLHRIEERRKMK